MPLFKETEKPFEKFLRFALYTWLILAAIFAVLISLGIVKISSKSRPVQPTAPVEAPEHIQERMPALRS